MHCSLLHSNLSQFTLRGGIDNFESSRMIARQVLPLKIFRMLPRQVGDTPGHPRDRMPWEMGGGGILRATHR